jgi:transposase
VVLCYTLSMKNDDKLLKKEDLLALDKEALVALFSSTVDELSSFNNELISKNQALSESLDTTSASVETLSIQNEGLSKSLNNFAANIETLSTENKKQSKTIADYEAKLRQATQEYERLMEQIILAKKDRFGSKSEKSTSNQLNLFNEAELFSSADLSEEEDTQEETDHKETNKSAPKGKQKHMLDDANLRSVEIVHDVSAAEKEGYEWIGKETKKLLRYQPSEWYIEHHIYPKYRKNTNEYTSEFISAPMLPSLFRASPITSSGLARIISLKYNLGLPLYRLERDLKAHDVQLSRQTLSNWSIKATEEYFSFLNLRMREFLLKEPILHADETTVQVLNHQDGSTNKKSYMWVYRSGTSNPRPLLVYDYQPGRSHVHPLEFLKGYHGYLQTDGYQAYDKLIHAKRVGCLAHARRKFIEAKEVSEKNTEGFKMASALLKQLNRITGLDKKTKLLSYEEKQESRNEKQRPVLMHFKQLLIEYQVKVLDRTNLGRAIQYSLNQFDSFERVLEDPRLEWTNNSAERAVKPFVMGRKAWLFSNTTRGAQSSGALYSIVQSALENKLHVERYLTYVLDEMTQKTITSEDQFDYLLPNSESLPSFCYQKN